MRKATNLLAAIVMGAIGSYAAQSEGPFLATGIKIGEVDQTSAIVWVRLTRNAERVGYDGRKGHPLEVSVKHKIPLHDRF